MYIFQDREVKEKKLARRRKKKTQQGGADGDSTLERLRKMFTQNTGGIPGQEVSDEMEAETSQAGTSLAGSPSCDELTDADSRSEISAQSVSDTNRNTRRSTRLREKSETSTKHDSDLTKQNPSLNNTTSQTSCDNTGLTRLKHLNMNRTPRKSLHSKKSTDIVSRVSNSTSGEEVDENLDFSGHLTTYNDSTNNQSSAINISQIQQSLDNEVSDVFLDPNSTLDTDDSASLFSSPSSRPRKRETHSKKKSILQLSQTDSTNKHAPDGNDSDESVFISGQKFRSPSKIPQEKARHSSDTSTNIDERCSDFEFGDIFSSQGSFLANPISFSQPTVSAKPSTFVQDMSPSKNTNSPGKIPRKRTFNDMFK